MPIFPPNFPHISPEYIAYAYKYQDRLLCPEVIQQIFASDPPPEGLDEDTFRFLDYIISEVLDLLIANRTYDLPNDSASSSVITSPNGKGKWDDTCY